MTAAPSPRPEGRARRRGLSLHSKLGLIFAALAVVLGLSLTAWYQRQMADLLLSASDQLFERISHELTFGFQRAYQPVAQTVGLLSRAQLPEAESLEQRLKAVPMLTEALSQQSEVTAFHIGYANGDFFLVRALRNDSMRALFSAPDDSQFMVEAIRAEQSGNVDRIFLNASLVPLMQRQDVTAPFDPRGRGWYQLAMQHSGVTTTEPYLFFFLQRPGMTVARQASNGRAVVAADIKLESLSHTLSRFSITPGAETLLYESNGRAIAYRDQKRLSITESDGSSRIATVAELNVPVLTQLVSSDTPQLPKGWLGRVITLPLASEFQPRLAIAVPTEQLLSDAYDIRSQGIVVAAVLLVLVIPLSLLIARSISAPLRNLRDAAEDLAEGNFQVWLPAVTSGDEVGQLNYAFRQMRTRLVEYVDNLQRTTAEKERLQSELSIAHDIQMAMVPAAGHARLQIPGWELFAHLQPARSVGGDFFDVLPLSERKYLLLIGDVSDKGVGAALFMARTVTLAKVFAPRADNVADFLALLNDELARNNDSCMFVTLFCAMIDRDTGSMEYASAGHNPPLHLQRGQANWLAVAPASPLGLFAGTTYDQASTELLADDVLIGYTDGITEAFNAQQQEFGDATLQQLAAQLHGSAAELGDAILEAVAEFSGDTPQSDDITLMIIRRISGNATSTDHTQ